MNFHQKTNHPDNFENEVEIPGITNWECIYCVAVHWKQILCSFQMWQSYV